MIVDTFPFFNELDLLEIRLEHLDSVVDKFVLVEAAKTQSLLDKPFYFEQNKNRFARFLDKIVHVKIPAEECPSNEGNLWRMENFQLNCVRRGTNSLNLKDGDIVVVNAIDEIPKVEALKEIVDRINSHKASIVSTWMTYNTFYLNLITINKGWTGTVATTHQIFTQLPSPYFLIHHREKVENVGTVENVGGWHFGNQGGKKMLYEKFHSCIEPFDKSVIPPYEIFCEEFDRKIKNGGSFLFSDKQDDSIKLQQIPLTDLPQVVQQNVEKYKHLLYNV